MVPHVGPVFGWGSPVIIIFVLYYTMTTWLLVLLVILVSMYLFWPKTTEGDAPYPPPTLLLPQPTVVTPIIPKTSKKPKKIPSTIKTKLLRLLPKKRKKSPKNATGKPFVTQHATTPPPTVPIRSLPTIMEDPIMYD